MIMNNKPLITPRDPYWRVRHAKKEQTHTDEKKADSKKGCRKKVDEDDA